MRFPDSQYRKVIVGFFLAQDACDTSPEFPPVHKPAVTTRHPACEWYAAPFGLQSRNKNMKRWHFVLQPNRTSYLSLMSYQSDLLELVLFLPSPDGPSYYVVQVFAYPRTSTSKSYTIRFTSLIAHLPASKFLGLQ